MTSVASVVAAGAAHLREAGFPADDAARDAGVLARHLLGWSLTDWLAHKHTTATPEFADAFTVLIGRRASHEPVAYLVGRREFYGRDFSVAPHVLIPRPETEGLIDEVLRHTPDDVPLRVLDIGAGSGCVAITLKLERPGLAVTSIDVSDAALSIARQNAAALGADVTFVRADLFPDTGAPWDLIVSNPPYVPERDRDTLMPDVRDHEPALALFAGVDGLDVVRRIAREAAAQLATNGVLCLEVGAGQQDPVTTLLTSAGLRDITWIHDLQGIPRIVSARR